MSIQELYCKGARVWVPDEELVWKEASLQDDYKGQSELSLLIEEDGSEEKIKLKSKESLPHLKNPEILIGENDLTSLSYLHEPAVLYNLQVRFCERNQIYTYCGIVLVAFNPYQSLPIYDADTIQAYQGMDMVSMDPHIFAVAEEAFKRMSRFEENQSIIVSGESGAGKTVSAKYAMRYFATVVGAQDETQVEKKVLASNPIMEAIGNAKTTRNDNSSRFGKYIEIGFSKSDMIIGANMRTYLLEKSRVVFQAPLERNYHIFYQICAAANEPEFESLQLNDPEIFMFTNQGEAPYIDGVDDLEELASTRQAFTLLGINNVKQMEIFRILSGILHLGNVEFCEDPDDHDKSFVPKTDTHLSIMGEMLGIDGDYMRMWLCNRKIITANETLVKPLTLSQSLFARDALAKHIYANLFNWIVKELNKSLTTTLKKTKFIGVLDIYGFETFEINSFEQFCINYANEKLQQQFCLHVFKLEQEEYVKEEIQWSFIDFYDNQPCIDLIEGKLGILDLLDEECKMPKGSDQNWCLKLYDKHIKTQHFSKPRMSQKSFIIHHFADDVQYQIDGFLEKNRDTVLEEQINILKASTYELIAELFSDKNGREAAGPTKRPQGGVLRAAREQPKSTRQNKKTVGSQFRESLNQLMETLFSTTPHYVRCIKPNDFKLPFTFEPKRAIQQLRACGVLETIRISAAGYPSRWTYMEFFQRYRVLAKSKEINRKNMRKTCENVVSKLIEDHDKYQFGKTKIFFRAGQVAYLEKVRSDKLRACGIMIQKHIRGWLAKRRYQKIRRSVLLTQSYGRGKLSRSHALYLKRTKACTRIQSCWRSYHAQRQYQKLKLAIITIQAYARAQFSRQKYLALRVEAKTIIIQAAIKGYIARKQYTTMIYGFTRLQAHVRRRAAKKELKQLKIEARSVEHIKTVAKGLENKIIQLQQKLDMRDKDVAVLREEKAALSGMKNDYNKLLANEVESKGLKDEVSDLQAIIRQLQNELEESHCEKQDLIFEKDEMKKQNDLIISGLTTEKIDLKEELDKANEKIKKLEVERQSTIKTKVQEAKTQLLHEFEMERTHHQKLVKDYGRLQQRMDNIQEGLELKDGGHMGHSRNPSNDSTISLESESELDPGYGSGRRRKGSKEEEEGIQEGVARELTSPIDLGVMSRLQNRVKGLERDKARLLRELDNREELAEDSIEGRDAENDIYNHIKLQELEMENSKLKLEMAKMRRIVVEKAEFQGKGKGSPAAKEFLSQFEAMADELERRREECIQLRTLLSSRSKGLGTLPEDAIPTGDDTLNEDGELELAYKTQKDLNKLLENELQRTQKNAESREKELAQQIDELKVDNDRQQKLIGQNNKKSKNLTMTPEAKIEATMQHEITRLTSENLDLREQIDKHQDQVKKLKKALKVYAKRLKATEASDVERELEYEMAADDKLPAVKHYRREYSGMLEYKREEEPLLVRNLITELRPRMAAQQLPGLPAYMLFMCIRHTDYMNDDEKVRSLLTNTINAIKKIVKKRQDDVETITLWLSNTCRLLHNLKQYSGEKTFQAENTPKQNEHCLRNFDLSEYRQILSDLAVWIYQGLIKLMESSIHPMIVGAVLEHEAIAGLSAGKPSGLRGRSMSIDKDDRSKGDVSLDSLLRALNNFMRVLNVHAMDHELTKQIFRQLFYFVCANALNNLLLRKDMCHWTKGMQIRYNMSHLEQWLRDNKLHESGAQISLEPIIQASQLLQARKSDTDVDSIVEMCSRLTTSQIIKILNLYTPVNEFEERVPISFIRKIQEKLSSRPQDSSQTLLMDTKFLFAVTFPFSPSSLGLEAIAPPNEWGLGFLKRY